MKRVLNNVAMFKKVDVGVQIFSFIIMIFAISQIGAFGMYAMAIAQCISCLLWATFFSGDTPRYKAGTFIRRLFVIVLILILPSTFYGELFFQFSLIMIILGPLMGIAYFVITIREINFYSKARKPYYLL